MKRLTSWRSLQTFAVCRRAKRTTRRFGFAQTGMSVHLLLLAGFAGPQAGRPCKSMRGITPKPSRFEITPESMRSATLQDALSPIDDVLRLTFEKK